MAYLNPPVGMVGTIVLTAPFTNAVVANLPYTVRSVTSLKAIAAEGKDPYALYYQDAGISADKYQEDLTNNVCIISLESSSGVWVYVPNSYLASLPLTGGAPYTTYLVAVNLGLLPDNLDLSYFQSQLVQLAHDLMGVDNAEVKVVAASATLHLSQADAATIETARQTVMSTLTTDRAMYLQEKALRESAIQRIQLLEQYITDNIGKLTAP